jgi:hypothetical protein
MDLQVLLAMGAKEKKKNHITNSQHLSNGDDAHTYIYIYIFLYHPQVMWLNIWKKFSFTNTN